MEIEKIKQLKDKTGASISLCREALEQGKGDMAKAEEILRRLVSEKADKKAENKTGAGIIVSYTHHDARIGVMLELRAQTDFVTRGEEFKQLGKEIALQVAANNPLYVSEKDIPQEIIEQKKETFSVDVKNKPPEMTQKIIDGRLQKWYEETCLMHQKYFKDETRKIEDLVKELSGKVGEKIEVARFVRLEA